MALAVVQLRRRKRLAPDLLPVLLFAALILLMLFSLTLGRYPVPIAEVVRIVFTTFPVNAKGDYTNAPWVVVEIVRMPRILLVTLCGMGLALSGATMQGVFRNPLVGPEVAGVTAGASLGGVAAILLSWPSLGITGLAFAFGLLALAIAFGLAKAANLPDAAAKVSLPAWRLAGAIVDDVRDLFPEVANNFGEGKISHGDLVTLRNVLEFVERLPTNVAPIEFDILARRAKEAIVSLLRGALEYVGHLN